jgi:hypothetical protein
MMRVGLNMKSCVKYENVITCSAIALISAGNKLGLKETTLQQLVRSRCEVRAQKPDVFGERSRPDDALPGSLGAGKHF